MNISQQLVNSARLLGTGVEKEKPEQPSVDQITTGAGVIPDFCRGEMVLNVVVLAQFVAIIFTIVTPRLTASIFADLFLISIFIQWIALMSVSALCLARPYLNHLPERRALLMAYLLLLCITWLVGELALWILATFELVSSARPSWYGYFHAQNLTLSAIINALALRYFVARHQLRLKTQSEERVRAEILRQKIRPHFLFNSMNIIASLTQRAPVRAEAAIEDVAELFRLMLDETKDLVPLHSEIRLARKYIKLEKLRLEQRLNVNWHVDSVPRTVKTPVLILQLLLENAVSHGIEQLPEGGDIDISVGMSEDEKHLLMEVANPLPERQWEGGPEHGSALDNIRLRLRDHYGDEASLKIEKDTGRFRVIISHPAWENDQQ